MPPSPPPAEPVPPTPPVEPTLLLQRGPVPVTPPSYSAPTKPRPWFAVPESMVVDARCRLIRDEDDDRWYLMEFLDPLPAGFPTQMRVLPGRELEMLEAMVGQDAQLGFRVTGQTTSYRGKAYVLPLSVAKDLPPPTPLKPEVVEQPTTSEATEPGPTSAEAPLDDTERIRESLTKNRPLRPEVPLPSVPPPPPVVSPGVPPPVAAPPGDILIDRTVRIVRRGEGQWSEARFEADNTLQEQPMPLLPCHLLERAEGMEGKVRITGVIRRYKGREYLLLRKAFAERDMGQL